MRITVVPHSFDEIAIEVPAGLSPIVDGIWSLALQIEAIFPVSQRHLAVSTVALKMQPTDAEVTMDSAIILDEHTPVTPFPNLWSPARLRSQLDTLFGNSQLCIIANREPCIHNRRGRIIETQFPASGLVTAVEPILRACSGVWIAHGSGSADRETCDVHGRLMVPPQNPEYMLKRVWLSKEEEKGYYYGFSNEGLWPLCHIAHTRPVFRSEDWENYQRVNERFADAFVSEMEGRGPAPVALIQDYHLLSYRKRFVSGARTPC